MRLHEASLSAPEFVHDGQRLVVEYSQAGTIARRHVHGPGIDEPLVWYEGAYLATRRYQHADERGSPVAVSSAIPLVDATAGIRMLPSHAYDNLWESGTVTDFRLPCPNALPPAGSSVS